MAVAVVLDHEDVEHPRQRQEGRRREEDQPHPAAAVPAPHRDGGGVDAIERPLDAAAQPPDDEDADRQERPELDHRLHGDGHDDAVVPLGGVEVARSEDDGEEREPQSAEDKRHNCQRPGCPGPRLVR